MKKTALAAALAVVSIGSAQAQSTTTLYGLADAFIGQSKTTGSSAATKVDGGGMSTSYWGFNGSEDLGGGLKAVFAFEGFMRNDTGELGRFGGDGSLTRNSYVGLAGGFGQVQLGRNTTPYFISTIVYNPFGDSFVFSPAVQQSYRGYLQNDSGWSNSVGYNKAFGPVRANLLYSMGQERSSAPNRNAGRSVGGSVNYGAGPLGLNFAFQQVDIADADKQTAMLFSGAYDLGMAKLFAQYQEIKRDTGAVNAKDKSFQLGASVKLGAGSVLASYGNVKTSDNVALTADAKRNTWALGYDYYISKRTDLYAAAFETKLQNPATVKSSVVGFGVRHRF